MKLEWNVINVKKILIKFSFFYNFLLLRNDFLFFHKNEKLLTKIYKFYKIQQGCVNFFLPSTTPTFLLFDKKNLKLNNQTIENILSVKNKTFNFSNDLVFVKKYEPFKLIDTIVLFFLFNHNLHNLQFKKNHNFKFLNIVNSCNYPYSMNVNKIFNRWKNATQFLFNIFYYNFKILIFGSYLFKNEILSLNWVYNDFDFNLWRYHFSFFLFKNNTFNKKIDSFYSKLSETGIDFFLITDPHYHFKNIYYFNRYKFFTVALTDINLDPFLFSYNIPISSSNILFQFLFFKFIILVSRDAFSHKLVNYKKIWWDYHRHKLKKI